MPRVDAKLRVAIVGAAGYVGGELARLLWAHPAVNEVLAYSESQAGKRLAAVHPALAHLAPEALFKKGDAKDAAEHADVVFLALPHGRSQQVMEEVLARDPRLLIDLGADFRVQDLALYGEFYGHHRAPQLVSEFIYGLADDLGDALRGQRRIAAPGCFATATLLGLRPLAQAGLLDEPVVCFAVTGSTGSGALPKPTTHHPVRAHNFYGYAAGGHRHQAEVDEQLRRWTGRKDHACRLVVHSAPLVRGISATLHARLASRVDDLAGLLRESWATNHFVHVVDQPPQLLAVVGTNHAHIHAASRAAGHEALIYVALDNLVKGAAGQAVQAMNLALDIEEDAGLAFAGLFPC